MAASRRTLRVQREMLRILSRVLTSEISDERLFKSMVTFSSTKVSPDFSYLEVWVSVQGEERHQRGLLSVIERAKPFFRRRLGEEMSLRIVPEIRFHLDQTLDQAARIEDLLQKVQEEREQRARSLGEVQEVSLEGEPLAEGLTDLEDPKGSEDGEEA